MCLGCLNHCPGRFTGGRSVCDVWSVVQGVVEKREGSVTCQVMSSVFFRREKSLGYVEHYPGCFREGRSVWDMWSVVQGVLVKGK